MVEAAAGDPVVSWKSLHADNLRFGLAPDRLEIAEVKLTELDGKLVIFKDKSLSVAKLMKPAGSARRPPRWRPVPRPASRLRARRLRLHRAGGPTRRPRRTAPRPRTSP